MFSHGETNWASPWIHFKEILTFYSFRICYNIGLEIYSAQLVSSLFPLEMFKANPRNKNSFRYWGFFNFWSSISWLLGQASLWKPSVKKCNKTMNKFRSSFSPASEDSWPLFSLCLVVFVREKSQIRLRLRTKFDPMQLGEAPRKDFRCSTGILP